MRHTRVFVGVLLLSLFGGVLLTPAQVRRDEKMKVTLDHSTEIPGQVLPAGTYFFKLVDSAGSQDIVEIWNEGETQRLAIVLAVRQTAVASPTGKPVVEYAATTPDTPHAIQAWFYGGQKAAQFLYSEKRAIELAKTFNENVPAQTDEVEPSSDLFRSVLLVVTPQGYKEVFTEVDRDCD